LYLGHPSKGGSPTSTFAQSGFYITKQVKSHGCISAGDVQQHACLLEAGRAKVKEFYHLKLSGKITATKATSISTHFNLLLTFDVFPVCPVVGAYRSAKIYPG